MSRHAHHLLGHVLACAVRWHLPAAQLLQSRNDDRRFWVDWLNPPETLCAQQLSSTMGSILQQCSFFEHRLLKLDELPDLFPNQPLKLQEGLKLARGGQQIEAYRLDGWCDFCDCQSKRIEDLKALTRARWSPLQSFAIAGGVRIEGALLPS